MGYRSEVGYVIQGPKEKMLPILMTYRMTHTDLAHAKIALSECTYDVTDDILTIRFHEDNIKWYDDFPEVAAHTALFNAFEEDFDSGNEEVINGYFARIGEETSDIVESHYGPDPYSLMGVRIDLYFEVEDGEPLKKVLGEL